MFNKVCIWRETKAIADWKRVLYLAGVTTPARCFPVLRYSGELTWKSVCVELLPLFGVTHLSDWVNLLLATCKFTTDKAWNLHLWLVESNEKSENLFQTIHHWTLRPWYILSLNILFSNFSSLTCDIPVVLTQVLKHVPVLSFHKHPRKVFKNFPCLEMILSLFKKCST